MQNNNTPLTYDKFTSPINAFRVDKHLVISAGATYTPLTEDLAFRVGESTTYYLGSASGVVAALPAGMATVINQNLTYTFVSETLLEIMGA